MLIHTLPHPVSNIFGCLQTPPPTHIATNTWHVAWWSCVKGPLKHIPRERMLILELRGLFYSMILWFLKMNPLEIRKNEEYENNGLLFLPRDLSTSRSTNLCSDRPDTYLQLTYPVSFTSSLPLAPNYKLSPESPFSQELSHLLASASPSMQMGGCFSNLYLRHQLFCSHLCMADHFDPTCWWCWGIYFSKTPKDLSRMGLTLFYRLLALLTSLICRL